MAVMPGGGIQTPGLLDTGAGGAPQTMEVGQGVISFAMLGVLLLVGGGLLRRTLAR